jgi:Spy/CpxP family protein refolding chaperone
MAQMNKTKGVIAMAGLLGVLALAGAPAFAQTSAPAAPATPDDTMMDHGMPNGQGGMMPGMMMNGKMRQKMTRMMDNCNRMMESAVQNKDASPAKKG